MNQPLVYCPYLYDGDKRCIPSKLSSRNVEKLITVCAFEWKECPIYDLKRNENLNRAVTMRQATSEIDAAEIDKILSDNAEEILAVPEQRNGILPEIEEPLISENYPKNSPDDGTLPTPISQDRGQRSSNNTSPRRNDSRSSAPSAPARSDDRSSTNSAQTRGNRPNRDENLPDKKANPQRQQGRQGESKNPVRQDSGATRNDKDSSQQNPNAQKNNNQNTRRPPRGVSRGNDQSTGRPDVNKS